MWAGKRQNITGKRIIIEEVKRQTEQKPDNYR